MWETPVFWASQITVSHTPTLPLQTSVMSYITRVISTMSRFGRRTLNGLFSHFFWFNLSAFRLASPPGGMGLPPEGEPCILYDIMKAGNNSRFMKHTIIVTKRKVVNYYLVPGIIQEAAPCVVFWYMCALRLLCSCALAGGILTCCLL